MHPTWRGLSGPRNQGGRCSRRPQWPAQRIKARGKTVGVKKDMQQVTSVRKSQGSAIISTYLLEELVQIQQVIVAGTRQGLGSVRSGVELALHT